jgi:hypothetical protein
VTRRECIAVAVSISGRGFEVHRDGKTLLSADTPVEIRTVTFHSKQLKGEIRVTKETQLRIGAGPLQPFEAGVSQLKAQSES